jgi:hypothetical protein
VKKVVSLKNAGDGLAYLDPILLLSIYNASVVKIYNVTDSLARFGI